MKLIDMFEGLTTSEISDALDACDIEGSLLGIQPIKPGYRMVGQAFTVQYKPFDKKPEIFQSAGDYIDNVPPGSIIVIDNAGRQDCTTWGGILTHVAKAKNIAGTVVFGAVRDIAQIKQQKYPVFSKAFTMRSGKNRVYKCTQQSDIVVQGITIKPHDIIFGDDNGVIVIPTNRLDEIIQKANNIKNTEARILFSVSVGFPLAEARKLHGYATPWVSIS